MPAGAAPRARARHSATLFGSDLVIVGGMPMQWSHARTGVDVTLLNLVHVEMQTSAAIETRVAREPALNATCALLSGTRGSPAQLWSCDSRLLQRDANASAHDAGDDYRTALL